MMESAARAEISELRTRLAEAHQQLAEVGTASAVSVCTEKIVARHACEEEMHETQQSLLVARAEVTHYFERQLWRALRFGPPEQLVRRRLGCRLEWIQLHCLLVWRALVKLKPEPQNLRELEVEIRSWEKARRLRRGSFHARKFFSAWRCLAEAHERGRLQRLIDLAHDAWYARHEYVCRSVDRQFYMKISFMASRCFIEWLHRYQKSRQLARFWRWLGKERKLLRHCFVSLLRAVSASRKENLHLQDCMRTAASSSADWSARIHMLERANSCLAPPSLATVP